MQLHRPGRLPGRLLPARGQRVLPAAVQHRRLAGGPQQHQRHADHAGQRHRGRARHRHLAAPGADLQRQHRSPRPSTAPPSAPSPTPPMPRGWSASAPPATRPTSSTTCPSPRPAARPRRTGPIVAGVNSAKCVDDNGQSTANGTKIQMWDCNGGAEPAVDRRARRHPAGLRQVHGHHRRQLRQRHQHRAVGPATAAPTSSGTPPTAPWSTPPPASAWTTRLPTPPTAPSSSCGPATAAPTSSGPSPDPWDLMTTG